MKTWTKIATGAAAAIIAAAGIASCGDTSTEPTTTQDTMAQAQQAYDQAQAEREAQAQAEADAKAAEKQAKIDAARATGITPETHARQTTRVKQDGPNAQWHCYISLADGSIAACYGDNQPEGFDADPWSGIWTGQDTTQTRTIK